MRVLETFVRSKSGDPNSCEDVVAITPDFVAVFDGASDVTGRRYDGVPGGRLAAQIAARALADVPGHAAADDLIDHLTEALATRSLLQEVRPLQPGINRPRTTMLVYSRYRRELWRIGDSGFALDGTADLPSKPVGELAYGLRAAYTTALLAGGTDHDELAADDPGFHLLKPFYRAQGHLVNRLGPYGYGALDGSAVPHEFIERIQVPADIRQLVLVSDGYPFIRDCLAATEAELAALMQRDPLGIREWTRPAALGPTLKAFDDRAWVRVDIAGPHSHSM